ncbi:DUF3800 domain-containing protein [Brevundimonas sp. BH3]|uniref:DUF3800 domain-containing protein n=1 Tax=Brevundimonas sp. BH3 TaxID=3133089 RepID=UPI003244FE79
MDHSAPLNIDQLPLFAEMGSETTHPDRPQSELFGKYIVYVDESGDHGMVTIDKQYPVFVLAFCTFNKDYYSRSVVNTVERFKFDNFGHDIVILHEREIRKELAPFNFKSKELKDKFQKLLSNIVHASNFVLISAVIDKTKLSKIEETSQNPYHIALRFCLEQLYAFLKEKGEEEKITHVVVECRGSKEDKELELEFRRICDGENRLGFPFPFQIIFADKKANSSGLQLADLVARPIGLSVIRPDQPNRAFDILKHKFFCRGGRTKTGKDYEGLGYMVYPQALKKRKAPVIAPRP